VNLERLFSRRAGGVRLELETITAVHRALGCPTAEIPAVHVVGTNGKGSVAALVEHGLRARGHRVGLYTSPHLMRVTERIRTLGEEIEELELEAAVDRVLAVEAAASLPRPLSFFEVLTLAALWHMQAADLDVIVAEAGLGGRLDATRLVNPSVVALTAIDLDHQALLGDDLASIAAEKAAVLRPGVPCICAPQHPVALEVVSAQARRVGAPLTIVEPLPRVPGGLAGEHQRMNAAVALDAARAIDPQVRLEDLDGVSWPGRLEWIPRGRAGLLLDAAHNPAGIEALVRYVLGDDAPELADAVVVFGCAPDKDRAAMLEALLRLGRPIWWVPPNDGAEAEAPPDAARAFRGWDDPGLLAAIEDQLVHGGAIVCGSHMLVGPLRHRLLGHAGAPQPTDPRVVRA
jgi:dihydrofolate synthase / folylpolyglutamate synthase